MADQGQTNTQSTNETFGESKYGERLNYATSQYKDLWAFIAFYVHVVAVLVIGVILMISDGEEETTTTTSAPVYGYTITYEPYEIEPFDTSPIWITLGAALFAGIIFAMIWLKLIQMFAESIIKILLFVQIGCWVVVAVLGVAYDAVGLIIIGILFALIFCLYTWCIWSRIPFAAACLSIASTITMKYHGTVWYALLTVFLNFFWQCIWSVMAFGYTNSTEESSGLVNFLILISLYWGVNTFRNVSHTTTCGVAATWYFNSGELDNPSRAAFKRTMTTSFGSVSFGSLLVAILQAIRVMVKSACGKCGYCILVCIERIMRYFNKYAFAQVAIYGTSFWESGSRTWDLFMSRGIAAIVNDDLSGLALTCGAFLGLLVSCAIGWFVGEAFYPIEDSLANILIVIVLMIIGGMLGYYVVVIVLLVVASGVVALFVCFAEDPAACQTNRPDAYAKFTGASPQMKQMADEGTVTAAA